MGLFDLFSNKTKIFSFGMFLGYEEIHTKVEKHCEVVNDEYIRLWAFYQAKITYNLGYPDNIASDMALDYIRDVTKKGINANTDCLEYAGVSSLKYSDNFTSDMMIKITGEYLSKDNNTRLIVTHFPPGCEVPEVIYSSLALMQYVINKINSDENALKIFRKTVRNLLALYDARMGGKVSDTVKIPQIAYFKAVSE